MRDQKVVIIDDKKIVVIIKGRKRKPRRLRLAKRFTFRWGFSKQSFVEGMRVRLTTEEQVTITVAPKTEHGRDAPIEGSVEFTSSDPTVATVTSTGPLTALVVALKEGATQVLARFDANLNPDVVDAVEASGAVEVVPAQATRAEIVFGPAEGQPA